MELTGTIKAIYEARLAKNGNEIVDLIITTKEKYPQHLKFQFYGKNVTEKTDGLESGDEVKVHFDIRGREYNGKYFVNLSAWKIELIKQAEEKLEEKKPIQAENSSEDDLPF